MQSKFAALLCCLTLVGDALAGDALELKLESVEGATVLELRSQMKLPMAGSATHFDVEWSEDLSTWGALTQSFKGIVGVEDGLLREVVMPPAAIVFYRARARVVAESDGRHADSVYGYAAAFERHLRAVGQLPLDTFVSLHKLTNIYRQGISFDPASANYWPAFNLDPAVHNSTNSADPRLTDFRLNEQEAAVFRTNGYVVSQRLGSASFADAFYKVFTDDLPVYITTDAMLQAWHRSYVTLLAEIEEGFLAPRMAELIEEMQEKVGALDGQTRGTVMENGALDADFFLAVAQSLSSGTNHYGMLGQTNRVQEVLNAISERQIRKLPLFGDERIVDFSQFKPRGHYENTVPLQRYFKAMMWCGFVDFRFSKPDNAQSLREFSGAVALSLLLERSGQKSNWMQYDQTIRGFVGLPDCLNFAQLGDLIAASGLQAPFGQLGEVYAKLWAGDLGVQDISSGVNFSPLGPQQGKLPRSFAMMPQRFLLDSWAMTKVVFDRVIWDTNGIPEFTDKVPRRVTSGLDTAFSVFGNDHTVEMIAERIAATNGHPWRDGRPYQHNLTATRRVVDEHASWFWTNDIYTAWVACLRALSEPTTDGQYPQAMQTRAWADSALNTQLASWTQLRHDMILHAKQPYNWGALCGYPDAWVEPRPKFWRAMGQLVSRARDLVEALPGEGSYTLPNTAQFTHAEIKTYRLAFFDRFAAALLRLESISEKELAHVDLSAEEMAFLEDTVEIVSAYNPGYRTYSGWYPKIFYTPIAQRTPETLYQGSGQWDPLVADVFTNLRDEFYGDPGSVLHEAVGNVHMAFIAIDCRDGHAPRMFAGPVLSHYEFETALGVRKSDSEWKAELKAGTLPPAPPWTRSFLVPGSYIPPANLD